MMNDTKKRHGLYGSLLRTVRAAKKLTVRFSAIPRPDHVHVIITGLTHVLLFLLAPAGTSGCYLGLFFDFSNGDTNIMVIHGVLVHASSL